MLCLVIAALAGWSSHLRKRLHELESAHAPAIRRWIADPAPISTTASVQGGSRWHAGSSGSEYTPEPVPAANDDGIQPFHWSTIEHQDYQTFIRNLRSIGCPEETIRDIVLADVSKLYAARRRQLLQPEPPPYWQTAPKLTPEQLRFRSEELRRLETEKVDTIRKLLGVDPTIEKRKFDTGSTYTDNRLGKLPPEKQDLVSLIREEFNEKWNQLQTPVAKSAMSPDEISSQLREFDEQRLARLAEILTPAELDEHELQTSWTSIQLRKRLEGFNASESEFRMLYELQKEFDNEFVHYFHDRTDESALLQKQQQQEILLERFRQVLGDERHAELMQLWH